MSAMFPPLAAPTAITMIPLEIELEHRWQRDLDEKTQAVRSAIRTIETHFDGIDEVHIQVDVPDREKGLAEYRKAVDKLKTKFGLSIVPFTSRSVAEIFTMAAIRHSK
jgi:hypothetical protein